MYIRLIIILVTTSLSAQNFGGNIGLIGHFPQGEFKQEGVTTGLGLDINGMYYPVKKLAFGLNLGGSVYDYSEKQVPLSLTLPDIIVNKKTSKNIGYGHIFFRIIPFSGNIQPYMEGLIGAKNLYTTTEIENNNCYDNDEDNDDCQIAESTTANDYAFSYGVGGGLEIKLTTMKDEEDNPSGTLSFFLNGKYLWGTEAEYLTRGSIVEDTDVHGHTTVTLMPSESRTDLFQLTLGLSIYF